MTTRGEHLDVARALLQEVLEDPRKGAPDLLVRIDAFLRDSLDGGDDRIEEAVQDVRKALLFKGRHPDYHDRMMARLRTDWPTLAQALDDLLEALDGPHRPPPPPPWPEVETLG